MRRNALWLMLLIMAAGAGYVAGARTGEGSGARAAPLRATSSMPGETTPGNAPAVPVAADPQPTPEAVGAMRDLLVKNLKGETPDEARVQDAARRAGARRAELSSAADNAEAWMAGQVAGEIRRERAFLEDKARGGTMELLRKLDKEDVRLPSLVDDVERFSALFERRTSGPAVDGAVWTPDDVLPDGATLSYPAGVHELRWPREERFPRDLLIVGSGMDATLLRLSYSLQTSDEVHSLAFRDLTIDGHGNGRLFTPRGPAAIRLERCRVVGFRDMLDGNQAAFHAVSCRFEAGFGDPAFDRLFQLRAGVLRLDDCVIQGPFESICDSGRATCLFSRCEILDAPARQRSRLESPPAGVRFEGCRVTYQPADVPARQPRPLTDLNPAWKD